MNQWHWSTPDHATMAVTGLGLWVIAGIYRRGETWRSYFVVDGTYDDSSGAHKTPEEAATAAWDGIKRMADDLMRVSSDASRLSLPQRPEEVKP